MLTSTLPYHILQREMAQPEISSQSIHHFGVEAKHRKGHAKSLALAA